MGRLTNNIGLVAPYIVIMIIGTINRYRLKQYKKAVNDNLKGKKLDPKEFERSKIFYNKSIEILTDDLKSKDGVNSTVKEVEGGFIVLPDS